VGVDEVLGSKRDEILRIAASHGVTTIRLFGSVARGDARPDSDVDFLIETGAETSSWFPAGLVSDLEKILGRHVDVVTVRNLRPELRDEVLDEAVPL